MQRISEIDVFGLERHSLSEQEKKSCSRKDSSKRKRKDIKN
jgi:hypothetical protein